MVPRSTCFLEITRVFLWSSFSFLFILFLLLIQNTFYKPIFLHVFVVHSINPHYTYLQVTISIGWIIHLTPPTLLFCHLLFPSGWNDSLNFSSTAFLSWNGSLSSPISTYTPQRILLFDLSKSNLRYLEVNQRNQERCSAWFSHISDFTLIVTFSLAPAPAMATMDRGCLIPVWFYHLFPIFRFLSYVWILLGLSTYAALIYYYYYYDFLLY